MYGRLITDSKTYPFEIPVNYSKVVQVYQPLGDVTKLQPSYDHE